LKIALRIGATAALLTLAAGAASMPFRRAQPNPRSGALWIDRGLAAERIGDFSSAERNLLHATSFDRQYLPAWTLANFYFRRGNRDAFWLWAHRAAAMSYDDLAPLLELADRFDPGRALDRLGDSPKLRYAYFDLLIGENRFDAALRLARLIDDPARLREFTTRLIEAGRAADAVEIWNRIPASRSPTGEGFDWRVESGGQFRDGVFDFALDGDQPETTPLLERATAGGVRLRFEYSANLNGLRWALDSTESPPLSPSADWRAFDREFKAQPGIHRLVLFYRRDPGHLRASGWVKIRSLRALPSGLSY